MAENKVASSISGAGFLMAIGIGVAGYLIGSGFADGRAAEHFVTVKGVSERDVEPDIALWSLSFVATDDNLAAAQQQIEASRSTIEQFLADNGIDTSRVTMQSISVDDRLADPYRNNQGGNRYIVRATLLVRSDAPETVRAASQNISHLINAGVVLNTQYAPYAGPTYVFSGLNDLKPDMIAEATREARRAAQQFAEDSGSTLGGIRRANQGLFQILPRSATGDTSERTAYEKTVRVVSTLEYLLED